MPIGLCPVRTCHSVLLLQLDDCIRVRFTQLPEQADAQTACLRTGVQHQRWELVVVSDEREGPTAQKRGKHSGCRDLSGLVNNHHVKCGSCRQQRMVCAKAWATDDGCRCCELLQLRRAPVRVPVQRNKHECGKLSAVGLIMWQGRFNTALTGAVADSVKVLVQVGSNAHSKQAYLSPPGMYCRILLWQLLARPSLRNWCTPESASLMRMLSKALLV